MIGTEFKTTPNEVYGVNNKHADYGTFAVSFLPWHDKGMGPETKDGETALIYEGRYYILNGDWCLTYSELAPQGAEACYAFFCSKYNQFGSGWSERPQ